MTEKFEPQPAIYNIITEDSMFCGSIAFAKNIFMDTFLPLLGHIIFKDHSQEMVEEYGISRDLFFEYECTLTITAENYVSYFDTKSKLISRKFNNGTQIIFDPTRGSINVNVDRFNNPVLRIKTPQLGAVLRECSYAEPSPKIIGEVVFNEESRNDPQYQKYIIQVKIGEKKAPVELVMTENGVAAIQKRIKENEFDPSNVKLKQIKIKSSVFDFIDKVGCERCGYILPPKSEKTLKKMGRVYCPKCGRLIQLKIEY